MAELQPPELPTNGGEAPAAENPTHLGLTSKRQRRPSVRLGDIGDQPATLSYESYRRNKLWRDSRYQFHHQKDPKASSRTRPLTNLGNGHETLETLEGDGKRSKGRDLKGKRGVTKRVRSSWVSSRLDQGYERFSGDDLYRGFDGDRSESPLREQSPVQSMEDTGLDLGERRGVVRARGVESRDHGEGELDGRSENDAREWRYGESVDRNGDSERGLEEGVRMWLNGLGLGRYEPVFEINEVDEEVLPLLTLEDLKDMGISAVGSRRKLYSAIQKLGRGFS